MCCKCFSSSSSQSLLKVSTDWENWFFFFSSTEGRVTQSQTGGSNFSQWCCFIPEITIIIQHYQGRGVCFVVWTFNNLDLLSNTAVYLHLVFGLHLHNSVKFWAACYWCFYHCISLSDRACVCVCVKQCAVGLASLLILFISISHAPCGSGIRWHTVTHTHMDTADTLPSFLGSSIIVSQYPISSCLHH